MSACSHSEKASVPAPSADVGSSTTGPAPEIAAASLFPEKPTAATQLIAHYTLRSPQISGMTYTYTVRWFVNNALVQEAPVSTLDPGNYVKGSEVYAEISPSNPQGAGRFVRTNVLTIGNLRPVISSVSLAPIDPPVGAIMTATAAATDPDGDEVALTYQWYVNGKPVTEFQKSKDFSTVNLRKKDLVFAIVAPSDETSAGELKESEIIEIANSAPQITSTPQYSIQNGSYQYPVKAKDPDGDALTYRLIKSPPGMTIDSSTGLIHWNVPLTVQEKQDLAIKISADDGDGGTAYQEYSLILEMK